MSEEFAKEEMTEKKARSDKNKKTRRTIEIIVLIIILLLACIFGYNKFFNKSNDAKLEEAISAELGQLENKSNDEIEAELNRVVSEGEIAISINSNPVFVEGTEVGTLQIENSPANMYGFNVVITRNDTGEVIYESGLVRPNYHIQEDKLLVDLEKGDYDCTAVFHALDLDSAERPSEMIEVGTAGAQIIISVLS